MASLFCYFPAIKPSPHQSTYDNIIIIWELYLLWDKFSLLIPNLYKGICRWSRVQRQESPHDVYEQSRTQCLGCFRQSVCEIMCQIWWTRPSEKMPFIQKNETARNLTEKRFRAVCTCSSDEAGRVQGVPVWRIETFAKVLWGFMGFLWERTSVPYWCKKAWTAVQAFEIWLPDLGSNQGPAD